MEKDKKSAAPPAALGNIVSLNVGGQLYSTSLQTITRDPESMLGRMFLNAGKMGLTRDAAGNVFIDRDGTHFRYSKYKVQYLVSSI